MLARCRRTGSKECLWHRRDACSFMMGMGRAVHRRGDSCSSLRSEDSRDREASEPGPRPVFFLHGVGLGMVSLSPSTHTYHQQAIARDCPSVLFTYGAFSRKASLDPCGLTGPLINAWKTLSAFCPAAQQACEVRKAFLRSLWCVASDSSAEHPRDIRGCCSCKIR